ncbi:MAG: ankyrin repeat domain-containing protein [archaeon]|nr:ankyrin repeat domain-containing protein [archaeon]
MSNNPNQKNISLNLRNIQTLIEQNKFKDLEILLTKGTLSPMDLKSTFFLLVNKIDKLQTGYFCKILEILLKKKLNVDTPIVYSSKEIQIMEANRITLLMLAIMRKDMGLTKYLLSKEANPNIKDSADRNAMVYSILYNNDDSHWILSMLINSNGDVNSRIKFQREGGTVEEHSLFTLACSKGLVNIVRVLMENSAYVNFKSHPSENTGLHIAVENENINLVKLLLFYNDTSSEIGLDYKNAQQLTAYDIAKEKKGEILQCFLNYFNGNYDTGIGAKSQKKMYKEIQGQEQFNNNMQRNMNNVQGNPNKYYQTYQNYPMQGENIKNNYMNNTQNMNNPNIKYNRQNQIQSQIQQQPQNQNEYLTKEEESYLEVNKDKLNEIQERMNSDLFPKPQFESNHLEIPVNFQSNQQNVKKSPGKPKLNNFISKSYF